MTSEEQFYALKVFFSLDKINNLPHVFIFVEKKALAERAGIKYGRFLYIIDNPKSVRKEEILKIAKAIGVRTGKIKVLFAAWVKDQNVDISF